MSDKIFWTGITKGNKKTAEADLINFNGKIKNLKDLKEFTFKKGNNLEIKVDLLNAQISINDKLEIKEENVSNISYINFRRKHIELTLGGEKKESLVGYGIGFKGEKEGKLIKRYILVKGENHELIKE